MAGCASCPAAALCPCLPSWSCYGRTGLPYPASLPAGFIVFPDPSHRLCTAVLSGSVSAGESTEMPASACALREAGVKRMEVQAHETEAFEHITVL